MVYSRCCFDHTTMTTCVCVVNREPQILEPKGKPDLPSTPHIHRGGAVGILVCSLWGSFRKCECVHGLKWGPTPQVWLYTLLFSPGNILFHVAPLMSACLVNREAVFYGTDTVRCTEQAP